MAFKGDGDSAIPGWGPYGLVQDNCGEPFARAVNSMNLPHNSATAPVQRRAYIMTALRPPALKSGATSMERKDPRPALSVTAKLTLSLSVVKGAAARG